MDPKFGLTGLGFSSKPDKATVAKWKLDDVTQQYFCKAVLSELDPASMEFDTSLLFVSSEGLASGFQALGDAALSLLEHVMSEESFSKEV